MNELSKKLDISVLVVDDIKANRDIIKFFLMDQSGYRTILFENGNQVYEHIYNLKTDAPILLITDILMPDIDGLTLLKKLKTLTNVYSIVITGHGGRDDLKEAFEAGAIDFIRKPIEKIELISRVNNVIRIINTENELKKMALTDYLTGAHNRKYFIEHTDREIEIAKRYNQALSFIILDIDNFKDINDEIGHQGGDRVLTLFCNICKKNIRGIDHFCRFGGDEFVIALINSDISMAKTVAERIRSDVQKLEVKYEERTIRFTVSLGIAGYSEDCVSIDDVLRKADKALYDAKNSGRNTFRIR
jgi:two-component system, cell cycle response regulator